jgi:hypothetical protein
MDIFIHFFFKLLLLLFCDQPFWYLYLGMNEVNIYRLTSVHSAIRTINEVLIKVTPEFTQ